MSLLDSASPLAAVCPKAPGNAQLYIDDITSYVMWGVLAVFAIGILVSIGGVVAGRMFGMVHASKTGMVGGIVVFVAAIAYMVVPAMIEGIVGRGCL